MHHFIFFRQLLISTFFLYAAFSCRAQDIPVNQLVLPSGSHKIPFTWGSDKGDTHSALLIPVTLQGSPQTFYMQFDTGSPYSLLYRNKLKDIHARYPVTEKLTDTTTSISHFTFNIGSMQVLAREISVQQFDNTGISWRKNAINIIGTLGTDLIDQNLVQINYPEKYLLIGNMDTTGFAWNDFIYERRKILLPASINGRNTFLYFDTGSSSFDLLTSEETARSLAKPGAVPFGRKPGSWGKQLSVISFAAAGNIEIAANKLLLTTVSYVEGVSQAQVNAMKKMGIGGMTGNILFLKTTLILDTRKKKFSIR